MKVYADFNEAGFIKAFYDDIAFPPITETVPVKPDPYNDEPEEEWPTEQRYVAPNPAVPKSVVEITNDQRLQICSGAQNWRYDRATSTLVHVELPIINAPPSQSSPANWRAALDLWMTADKSKLTTVYEAIRTMLATGKPIAKVAMQELEYASTIRLSRLLQIRQAFGFTVAECEESMWRAGQIAAGDYRGEWPLPDGEVPSKVAP